MTESGMMICLIEQYLDIVDKVILEPAAGEGDIARALYAAGAEVISRDIQRGDNFLDHPMPQKGWQSGIDWYYDGVITNPPFSIATKFVDRAKIIAPVAIMLQRINWLGSIKRFQWWQDNRPSHLIPIVPRPSFMGGPTDSTEYGWYCWDWNSHIVRVPPGIHWLYWGD